MTDLIVILILLVIVGVCAGYVIRQKKRGVKCIGCPDSGSCAHSGNAPCAGCAGCAGHNGTCACHANDE